MGENIDFVIPWVDGSDPEWLSIFHGVVPNEDTDARASRYRDWGLLKYWFRGVEKFAPWVNRIHFITWGHLPDWLNIENPKLHIVNHRDYIPDRYLPTFSANTIELNIHRIKTLSRHFVYFNDDMFLLRPLSQSDFFKNNLPCDSALINPLNTLDLAESNGNGRIYYFSMNDVQQLNCFYSFRAAVKEHPLKWYNIKYGSCLIRNLVLSLWPRFVGFIDLHLPQAFLKESFEAAWEESAEVLDKTCCHSIRSDHDLNQWYIRYRQLAGGMFSPRIPIRNADYVLGIHSRQAQDAIVNQKHPMICINDGLVEDASFEKECSNIKKAFESVFPQKSTYEL